MTAPASAFSSSDTAVLERQIDVEETNIPEMTEIWSEWHCRVCINWIRQNGYKRVCLQFPDHYLPHCVVITDNIKASLLSSGELDTKMFIMADTAYGNCCVDEISAAHVEADSIIHFGNACRSKVLRLPVLYMYPKLRFDMQQFFQHLDTLKDVCVDKEVCVYLDIGYHHLLELENSDEHCLSTLKQVLPCKELYIEPYPVAEDAKSEYEPVDDRICIFVGSDNKNFFNLSITTKAAHWYIYDAVANTLNEKNPLTSKFIRRRYYYIEKCKDAQTLGLLVATLSTEGYMDAVARLQDMAKKRGIKTQIISVGRINPAKLANFFEIDCFVLIGCPFNNSYNSKEFYKPIVSVFEAEMALNPAWHMKYPEAYVTDFKQLLPEGRDFLAFNADNVSEQDVSLISGRLRSAAINDTVEVADNSALSEQQQALLSQGKMEVMTTNTGLSFEDRTWKGLDPALGCTEPAKLQKGLKGIPIKYSHD